MKRLFCVAAAIALLMPVSTRVFAHHSFAAEFEYEELTWTGAITRVEWRLPHVHFYVDVKDNAGNVENWCFEMPSPEQLVRRGMNKTFFKAGEIVTVSAYPARNKQPIAMTRTVTRVADKQLMFVTDYEDFGGNKIEDILITPNGERLQPKFP